MPIRCLIVDDNVRVLEAARARLDDGEGLEVVGTATTGEHALRQVAELRPDVVLVDVSLGRESGFELTEELVERFPWLRSRIVLISTRAHEDYADLIEASPAVGFVTKTKLSAKGILMLVFPTPGD